MLELLDTLAVILYWNFTLQNSMPAPLSQHLQVLGVSVPLPPCGSLFGYCVAWTEDGGSGGLQWLVLQAIMCSPSGQGGPWQIFLYASSDGIKWLPQNIARRLFAHCSAPPRRDVRISFNTLSSSSSSSSSTSSFPSSASSFSALPGRYGGPGFSSVNGHLQPKWQSDGLYHLWFHAFNGSGNLPRDTHHAQSRDLLMWNVTAPPALKQRAGVRVRPGWLAECQWLLAGK